MAVVLDRNRRRGDFAELFRREFASIVRTAYLIVDSREAAEDIAQDAFVQLLRHWTKVSRYDRPEAWVRRVAIRLAVHSAKRERRRRLLERQPGDIALIPDQTSDVVAAVRHLPAIQRAAIALFYFEDRPVVEVADILGLSVGAVKQHLHRARRRIGELLAEEAKQDVG
jgi:RNA polymerase sigma factor (sigma-70 family)